MNEFDRDPNVFGGKTELQALEERRAREAREEEILKLSTGQPSTLKSYRGFAAALFPKALPMLDARIEKYGEDEVVVQDERQMIYLLGQIEFAGAPEHPAVIFTESEQREMMGLPKDEEV
jgi:hypothetical protein